MSQCVLNQRVESVSHQCHRSVTTLVNCSLPRRAERGAERGAELSAEQRREQSSEELRAEQRGGWLGLGLSPGAATEEKLKLNRDWVRDNVNIIHEMKSFGIWQSRISKLFDIGDVDWIRRICREDRNT